MRPGRRPARFARPAARTSAAGRVAAAVALLATHVACLGPPPPVERIAYAHAVAAAAGLEPVPIDAGAALPIAAWRRRGDPALPARIYIEGDGMAFLGAGRRSDDPTPVRPVALEIARRDAYPGDLIVLGRPCQFEGRAAPACDATRWTVARYGEDVVAATNARIDGLVPDRARIDLAGFSGGGVIATLVAARRADVAFLTTFAAPLDVAAWTAQRGVPDLVLSLSPIDFAAALRDLPQQHFSSEADRVVPPAIGRRYVEALGPEAPATLVIVPQTRHADWSEVDLDRVWADR